MGVVGNRINYESFNKKRSLPYKLRIDDFAAAMQDELRTNWIYRA